MADVTAGSTRPRPATRRLRLSSDRSLMTRRMLAANWMANEAPGQTLQPTALVH